MDNHRQHLAIKEFLNLFDNQMLKANPEYQRGSVWSESQKKKLIDSVMRKYPLPVIYLHHICREAGGYRSEHLEIIDGQQRLNAIREFHVGAFRLFDPVLDDVQARFPRFLQNQLCPWARESFDTLTEDLQARFLDAELPVAYITSEDTDEVRDLFVRLQAGLPLTPQEKRDAHPGDFNHFVLKLGGKPGLIQYPGFPFFRLLSVPNQARGGIRTLAAQIAMLFLTRREKGPDGFIDISSGAVDDYYYRHIDFDSSSNECQRLIKILEKLHTLLSDGKRPNIRSHIAIHLALFLDDIWDHYTPAWQSKLSSAVDQFIADLATATKMAKDYPDIPNEVWTRYGQGARTRSDSGSTIEFRHKFFVRRMRESLGESLQMKDHNRVFGELDRQIIYYRDGKRCQACHTEVPWEDVEIHHVLEHHSGGRTDLKNGALVHRACHPKGEEAVRAFAENWFVQ